MDDGTNELVRFYVLQATLLGEPFYAIFTDEEFKLLNNNDYIIDWIGRADSQKTAAQTWLARKGFPNLTQDQLLETFED